MPYLVKTSCAKMPGSVRAPYRHTAVLEVEPDVESVAMISNRARGVVRIVREWGPSFLGLTSRSAAQRDLAEARILAAELNK